MMYFDAETFLALIETYYSQVKKELESDKSLVQYFYKKLELDNMSESKNFEIHDYYDDMDNKGFTKVHLVTTLSNSLIISIYGKYEHYLGVLCNLIQRNFGIGISYTMIKGQGIIAAVKYLDNMLNINIMKTEVYKQTDIWRELRNTITHNLSVPNEEKKYETFEKIDIHKNGEYENIVTSMNDCLRLIKMFERLFETVIKELENKACK